MYWSRHPTRSELEGGKTFVHGTSRLNLGDADLTTFVDPPDAALMFGFRALTPGDPFEKSFAVWMATLRRRGGSDAIVESLQRIFPNLVDEGSLIELLRGILTTAQSFGYEKVWFAAGLFNEALLAPSLAVLTKELGQPLAVVPTTGMAALSLARPPPAPPAPAPPAAPAARTAEEARQHAQQLIYAEYEKANALRNDRHWEHGRGNVQAWVASAYAIAGRALQTLPPAGAEPAQAYLLRVAASVREARRNGPDEDDESWFDGAIDQALSILSLAATGG